MHSRFSEPPVDAEEPQTFHALRVRRIQAFRNRLGRLKPSMKYSLVLLVVAGVLFGVSCSTMKPPTGEEWAKLTDNQAAIYVGKRYRGLTPREIRVRLGFGETSLTLRRGNEVVRDFEFERTGITGTYLPYLFGTDREGDALVYDVEDLEQLRDSTYVVPNLPRPFKIRDRRYGLMVWVED